MINFQIKMLLLIAIFISLANITIANSTQLLPSKPSEIHIKSDQIIITQDQDKISFKDNVVITKDDVVMLSNLMLVSYHNDKQNIKDINLLGRVKILNDEFTASGNKGSYNIKKEELTLHENVIFNNGLSLANGEKFIYNFKTRKFSLISNQNNDKDKVLIIIKEND